MGNYQSIKAVVQVPVQFRDPSQQLDTQTETPTPVLNGTNPATETEHHD
jgi:hypothetical protein